MEQGGCLSRERATVTVPVVFAQTLVDPMILHTTFSASKPRSCTSILYWKTMLLLFPHSTFRCSVSPL